MTYARPSGPIRRSGKSSWAGSVGQLIGGKKFNTKISASGTGWDMKVAPEVKAKDPKQYKVVGQSVKRVELPAKVTGEHDYIHDVRIPNMLHGRVVRPPVINTEPVSIDNDSIKGIPGVVMIAREGKFVGVIAKTEWAAIKASQTLKVTWSKPTSKVPATPDDVFAYLKNTKPVRTTKAVDKGNATDALAKAQKTYQGSFRWPFQMHGMIGPSCAIADVKGDTAGLSLGILPITASRCRSEYNRRIPAATTATKAAAKFTPCRTSEFLLTWLTGTSPNRSPCAPATCARQATWRAALRAKVCSTKSPPI